MSETHTTFAGIIKQFLPAIHDKVCSCSLLLWKVNGYNLNLRAFVKNAVPDPFSATLIQQFAAC